MYDMKGVFVPKRKVLSLCYTIESVFSKGDPCEKLISIRGILEQFQNAIFIQKKKKYSSIIRKAGRTTRTKFSYDMGI